MIKGKKATVRDILYFTASLESQEPKKRFNDTKCNQTTTKKLSDDKTV